MRVTCPRCGEEIEPAWDHCHRCGLTVEQLERLLRLVSPGGGALSARDPTMPHADDGSPGYYAPPTYGQGPIRRSMGYAPPAPGVADLRRPDTVIDLTGGEARVRVTATGATAPVPPRPTPPAVNARGPVSSTHELNVTLAIIAVAVLLVLLAVWLTI